MLAALRRTAAGSALVGGLTAAPDLDGWVITERLLADLAPLDDRLWLVVDDVHELGAEALRQLELMIMRAPPELRFVLATRHDLRLGLHRLRLEGELAEIRGPFAAWEQPQLFSDEIRAAFRSLRYMTVYGRLHGLELAVIDHW